MNQDILNKEISKYGYKISKRFFNDESVPYNVWLIHKDNVPFILKMDARDETIVLKKYGYRYQDFAPSIVQSLSIDSKPFNILNYFPGKELKRVTKKRLKEIIDKLARIQNDYFHKKEETLPTNYLTTLNKRISVRDYLFDEKYEKHFDKFIDVYKSTTRTLSNRDLLPRNIIINKHRIIFVDWERVGFLPFPISIAGLLGSYRISVFKKYKYLKDKLINFALDYYYQKIKNNLNISYHEYLRIMKYFLFYEYSRDYATINHFNTNKKSTKIVRERINKVLIDI